MAQIPSKIVGTVPNEMVAGLPEDNVKKIKQKKRTLKNRGYAASCRVKKDKEEESLRAESEKLQVNKKYLTSYLKHFGIYLFRWRL